MALTSDDVVNYPLKHGMRGYVIAQVDELLDEVADELDRLHAEIEQLRGERDTALEQVAEARAEVERRADAEGELRRVLLRAETAAEEAMQEAQEEADDVVKAARLQAEQILDEAREQARRERDQVLADLDAQEARFRVRKRELMTRVERLQEFEQESRRLLRGLLEDQLARIDGPEIVDGLDELAGRAEAATPGGDQAPAAAAGEQAATSEQSGGHPGDGPAAAETVELPAVGAEGDAPDPISAAAPDATTTAADTGAGATSAGRDPASAHNDARAAVDGGVTPADDDLLDDLDDVMLLGDDPASGDADSEHGEPAQASRRRRGRSMLDRG